MPRNVSSSEAFRVWGSRRSVGQDNSDMIAGVNPHVNSKF